MASMPPLISGRIPECLKFLLDDCAARLSHLQTLPPADQRKGALAVLDDLKREYSRIADPDGIPWYPLTKSPRLPESLIHRLHEAWRGLKLLDSSVGPSRADRSDPLQQIGNQARMLCEEFDKATSAIVQRWVRPAAQTSWGFYSGSQAGKGNYPSVLAFPLVCSPGDVAAYGGIGYLMAIPSRHEPYWSFSGFARHEENWDQLDSLARLAVSIITRVPPDLIPPRELDRLRREFDYRTLYNAPISEGLSHTGATLVVFVLSYLHTRLKSEAKSLLGFLSNCVVSCEVLPDGSLQPVRGITLKLDALLDQWGKEICAVLGEPNEAEAVQWKKEHPAAVAFADNIRYVSNANDMVSAVLGSLDNAWREFWRRLVGSDEYELVWKPRLPDDLRKQVEELQHDREPSLRALAVGNPPVLVRSVREGNTAAVQLAFNEAGLSDAGLSLSRAILVLLSGCPVFRDNVDEVLWAERPARGYPLAPEIVYEILAAIYADGNNSGTTTYVQFLSDAEPVLTTSGPRNVEEIASALAARRQARRLDARGCFFDPALSYWRRPGRHHGSLDAYIVSNAEIPDLVDEAEDDRILGFNSLQRILIGRDAVRTWLRTREEDVAISLSVDDRVELRSGERARLHAVFGNVPQRLVHAALALGDGCPAWWHSPNGHCWSLHQMDGGAGSQFVLQAHFAPNQEPATSTSVVFPLPGATPTVGLRVRIATTQGGKIQLQEACAERLGFVTGTILQVVRPGQERTLTAEERARLGTDDWCAECRAAGRHAGHMFCRHRGDRISIETIDVFVRENIQAHKGVFAVCPEQGIWRCGPISVALNNASIVLCDGQPLVVRSNGHVMSPACLNDVFVTIDNAKWILFRVL